MIEFPKALYRDGNQMNVWGHEVDYRVVADAQEEAEAKGKGWRESPVPSSPLDADGDGKMGGSLDKWDQLSDAKLREEIEAKGIQLHHRAGRAKMLQILRGE